MIVVAGLHARRQHPAGPAELDREEAGHEHLRRVTEGARRRGVHEQASHHHGDHHPARSRMAQRVDGRGPAGVEPDGEHREIQDESLRGAPPRGPRDEVPRHASDRVLSEDVEIAGEAAIPTSVSGPQRQDETTWLRSGWGVRRRSLG